MGISVTYFHLLMIVQVAGGKGEISSVKKLFLAGHEVCILVFIVQSSKIGNALWAS